MNSAGSEGLPWWLWFLVVLLMVALAIWLWLCLRKRLRSDFSESTESEASFHAPPPPPAREPEVSQPLASVTPTPVVRPQAVREPVFTAPDDLKRIEGIGPKIASLCQAAGIATFAELAATDVDRLRAILAEARLTHLADPTTGPEQAELAAAARWDDLVALQSMLKRGRRA